MKHAMIILTLLLVVGCSNYKCFDVEDDGEMGMEIFDTQVCVDKEGKKFKYDMNIRFDAEAAGMDQEISKGDMDKLVEIMVCGIGEEIEEGMSVEDFLQGAPPKLEDELTEYMSDVPGETVYAMEASINGKKPGDCDMDKLEADMMEIMMKYN